MIYLPPPQPVLNKDIRISGDVEIHPTASLAPGVILQAAPNCSIVIGADVCIGMGVIINACQGKVTIESGAIIGSGVLIIGKSKVGSNACIGTSCTIFQQDVAAMKIIKPGAILGDMSRPIDEDQAQEEAAKSHHKSHQNNYHAAKQTAKEPGNNKNAQVPDSTASTFQSVENVGATVEPHIQSAKPPVVGQVYINELLVTLFPHRKDFDSKQ